MSGEQTLRSLAVVISLLTSALVGGAATVAAEERPAVVDPVESEKSTGDLARAAMAEDAEAVRSHVTPDRLDRVESILEHGIELTPGVGVDGVRDRVAGMEAPAEGGLVDAVLLAYERYGLPHPSLAELREMEHQAQRLDPDLERATAQLVVALADHEPVADRIDCCSSTVQGSVAGVEADPVRADPSTAPDLSEDERLQLFASALRIAEAIDRLVVQIQASQTSQGPSPAAGGDVLFSDPLDLVVVGGPGATTYTGNALGDPLAPDANLLTVDVGGDDTYRNNAGGARPTFGGNGLAAATAIDVRGNDVYQASTMRETASSQTLQGSGVFGGVGVLVDLGGHDTYQADHLQSEGGLQRVQGSGEAGVGILLDQGGDDTYGSLATVEEDADSDDQAVQGAGVLGGLGSLVDAGGSDDYSARIVSAETAFQVAQGGGAIGVGTLIDEAGGDRFELVAESGIEEEDTDRAQQYGQGGSIAGVGSFVDLLGDDELTVQHDSDDEGVFWVQGASQAGTAVATQIGTDIFGEDRWAVSSTGPVETHAHGDGVIGTAVLFEFLGVDDYVGPTPANNAGAWRQDAGVGVDIS